MKKSFRKIVCIASALIFCAAVFVVFFDQAVLVRRHTIYRVPGTEKAVALTFDDGPSPLWTPRILDELKEVGARATFFMVGEHVLKYPDIARRVAEEGHEIGNHSFNHRVLLYYTPEELEREIKKTEEAIQKITGKTTRYFRPPKAWILGWEKKKAKELGYGVVLWSLNSKDWVNFDDKYILKFLLTRLQPGDIILFHDGGGAFRPEGGDRDETILAVRRFIERAREKGYSFVTLSELLRLQGNAG